MMAVLVFGQFAIADNGGHYVPRTQGNASAESFMGSLRANQHTGLIDPALMIQAMQNQDKGTNGDLYWLSMGPDNMGGQTTAVLYDNQTNWVYIGSKGGGVYVTYNNGTTWKRVSEQNMMVSCMVQDEDGTIYVGTGDGGNKTAELNGLSTMMNYENSFMGSGIYTIRSGGVVEVLPSTVPAMNNDTAAWSFVNGLAISGKKLVAGTNKGLKYSSDNGTTWNPVLDANGNALTGITMDVRALSDGTLLASVGGKLYIGTVDHMVLRSGGTANNPQTDSLGNIISIPTGSDLMDIAVSPNNDNVIYVSGIKNSNGYHTGIYVSQDKGATWEVALPAVTSGMGYNVYEGYGQYNHGIVVDPADDGRLYILGYHLWKIERTESGVGNFRCERLTGDSYFYMENYLHVGLHSMMFNPKNVHECYIGTDGGIYKANASNGVLTFSNCNRDYITSRMFGVAYSGKDSRVLAAGIDHGTVLIEGDATLNTMNHGEWINPSVLGNNGLFDDTYHAGHCAISQINPNTIFVTTKGGDHVYRSETAGEDWVSTNFMSSLSLTSSPAFRMPILLQENFNDDLNPATVWVKNNDTLPIAAGTTMKVISNNNFPFDYQFTQELAVDDSIEVHDPISSRFYLADKDAIYTTRMNLDFAKETVWYELVQGKVDSVGYMGEFSGTPICMTMDAAGENLFVGTIDGQVYRFMGEGSGTVDSVWYTYKPDGSVQNTYYQHFVTIDKMTLPTDDGQCITSIAVDPRDSNKVIITLGNYGNDAYVLYSSDALSDNPTFVSKQGNLPKMPIYSSLIEMATGDIILGTEHGIYSTTDINAANWVKDSQIMGDVPVMELKQQLLSQEDVIVTAPDPEGGIFTTVYPGVHNKGIIYAATYGRGVFRCENYKQESGTSVPETSGDVVEINVSLYPNPVHGLATVSFNVVGNASVSYQVFDLTGRMVMNQTMGRYTEGEYEIRINTENLSTGSYIMRLNQGNNSRCVKFMVF